MNTQVCYQQPLKQKSSLCTDLHVAAEATMNYFVLKADGLVEGM